MCIIQILKVARMAKLVDAPASGAGGFTAVEVRVLFRAPPNSKRSVRKYRPFFISARAILTVDSRTPLSSMITTTRFPYWIERTADGSYRARFPSIPEILPTAPSIAKLVEGLQDEVLPALEARLKEDRLPEARKSSRSPPTSRASFTSSSR